MKYLLLLLSCLCMVLSQAQEDISQKYYKDAFVEIMTMLNDDELNFSEAVFLTENAYFENELNKESFDNIINHYATICQSIAESGNITYTGKDSIVGNIQCGVFTFMTDTVSLTWTKEAENHIPFCYNFEDFAGLNEWSNMFVTTLILTKSGNCHSLPYLYKMIMDRLGYESHLALAPNHIYIKVQNKKVGWYNIELTCGDFPTDAWLMASGYVHIDAIRNGIYMKALSDKESVAMTLIDLAQGFQSKYGIHDGNFILMCCNTALKHYPNYINALLLKAEVLTELYKQSNDASLLEQMNVIYNHIHETGYRKMPDEMYKRWYESLKGSDIDNRMRSAIKK